jgi:NADH-quinone oxidoreductase subunit I
MYKVIKKRRGLWEEVYIFEIIRGLLVTARHFFLNILPKRLGGRRYTVTLQYPDERFSHVERFRATHRLLKREDGKVKCVACMCCVTVCPAECIEIVAEEDEDPEIQKRPKTFTINELRCIFCGLCVEACPKEAIQMDSGLPCPPSYTRSELILTKEKLKEISKAKAPSKFPRG